MFSMSEFQGEQPDAHGGAAADCVTSGERSHGGEIHEYRVGWRDERGRGQESQIPWYGGMILNNGTVLMMQSAMF